MTQTKTLNFTPIFIAWSVIFVIAAITFENTDLIWWAAAPWIIAVTVSVVGTLLAGTFIWVKYMQGEPITVTTPRRGTRVIRRGR